MIDTRNCVSLNDLARKNFGKANYTNREKCKNLLRDIGIDWRQWIEDKKDENIRYCIVCGKQLTGPSQKKFCGCSCAAKFNNRLRKQETKEKISKTLREEHGSKKETSYCCNCGKELSNRQKKYCSNKCHVEWDKKEYIKRWQNGEEDGLRGDFQLSSIIRRYLLEKNNCKCEECGWGIRNEYTGTIPLEIHHKDGDYKNNKEENLQVLCPNCHSLTEQYKSHNKEGRSGRKKYYL